MHPYMHGKLNIADWITRRKNPDELGPGSIHGKMAQNFLSCLKRNGLSSKIVHLNLYLKNQTKSLRFMLKIL